MLLQLTNVFQGALNTPRLEFSQHLGVLMPVPVDKVQSNMACM